MEPETTPPKMSYWETLPTEIQSKIIDHVLEDSWGIHEEWTVDNNGELVFKNHARKDLDADLKRLLPLLFTNKRMNQIAQYLAYRKPFFEKSTFTWEPRCRGSTSLPTMLSVRSLCRNVREMCLRFEFWTDWDSHEGSAWDMFDAFVAIKIHYPGLVRLGLRIDWVFEKFADEPYSEVERRMEEELNVFETDMRAIKFPLSPLLARENIVVNGIEFLAYYPNINSRREELEQRVKNAVMFAIVYRRKISETAVR